MSQLFSGWTHFHVVHPAFIDKNPVTHHSGTTIKFTFILEGIPLPYLGYFKLRSVLITNLLNFLELPDCSDYFSYTYYSKNLPH